MNSFLNKLRLKWFVTTKTLGYTSDYLDQIYKIYLNHNKVIHWRDGYPVYSLSTPALYSKPAANFFARQLFRTIQNKNTPNIMSFAVNDVCNANCEHCSFFNAVEDKSRKVLTLEQSKKLIKDTQDLGVSVINFVGGEPLLRKDLPEIISSADKNLSTTILFTNGLLLTETAEILKRAGLDGVYVSVDSADPKKHDLIRNKSGSFEKAMAGIEKAKEVGLSTGISCVITPESFRSGELERLIKLGKSVEVHEVLVFDAMPTGRYKSRKDLIDSNGWVEEMISSTEKYNKDSSYPGVLVWVYTTSHRSVGCSCGTSYFYISPYGDMMSCDFNHAKFGNILETPLYQIWDKLSSSEDFRSAKWGGCKIKDSKYRKKETVSAG
ncbi:MAG: radical SAM protein [Candidatus Woykebacteria bacterium GWB1_45_5]|uniref:Radical SAM protein n=2 Tax=Candidatus Woykeibacteriota TaxID=1817899 RepID=A0A1G1W030_9BACT|nr:MAG: radical SAM protein [Candidatus Woykebacteria bacterium GWA1_44_8]OGY24747.1 MAG: radical SAM protein [Candidatus Woykebacteria bacterium GWB1_45_5]